MVQVEALRDQLETLLRDIAERGSGSEQPAGAGTADDPDAAAATYADALDTLSGYLTDAAEEAGEALAAHPLAAIGAAFMLGVAVGRMSRK